MVYPPRELIEIHALPFQFRQQRNKIVNDNNFSFADGFDKEFRQRQLTRRELLLKQSVFFIGQAKRHLMWPCSFQMAVASFLGGLGVAPNEVSLACQWRTSLSEK